MKQNANEIRKWFYDYYGDTIQKSMLWRDYDVIKMCEIIEEYVHYKLNKYMKKGNVIQGKILVLQDEIEEKTKSGIIIPSTIQEKPKCGEVVIVGPSTDRMKTLCEVGDRVFFPDHAGTPVAMDDEDIGLKGTFLLMDYTQILIYKG